MVQRSRLLKLSPEQGKGVFSILRWRYDSLSWGLIQGVMNVKKSNLNARFVFIKPPSLQELERRLRSRGSESDQAVQQRLETARRELEYAEQQGSHDAIIVNDDLDKAYAELEAFVLGN